MVEAVPAVALLFDDADLGEQLRSALQERGARIVHEGPLKGLSRELLASVDADVLVVNLDDEDDSALDRLEETLEGDRPRVVFNDAQASGRLEGWDRARWARHLAMKVLSVGDADPPRPPAPAQTATEGLAASAVLAAPTLGIDAGAGGPGEAALVGEEARQAAASEYLAAELEALLASDAPLEESVDSGAGLEFPTGEGGDRHEDSFGSERPGNATRDAVAVPGTPAAAWVVESPALAVLEFPTIDAMPLAPKGADSSPTESPHGASSQLDHLALAPLPDDATQAAGHTAPAAAPATGERAASADFGIEKVSAADYLAPEVDAPFEPPAHADFGIEKVSAADYLAPETEDVASPVLPGLSLELVPMEEAIAPQDFDPTLEVMPDPPAGLLPRLVVLGATTESTASVGEFLGALPAGLRATILHTQHLAGRPADGLAEYFGSQCALPVRLAEPGLRVGAGEVVVVPSSHQVAVRRDGSVEFQPVEAGTTHVPSIDATFTLAAECFGCDVVAIVFAGRSTDAVAGCQAVHDRGGQVWVEASGAAHASDMVSGVLAENLSHHAGTPRELAARLAEQYTEGQP